MLLHTPAPAFTTLDQYGKQVSLADFLGQKVVLFFYPRDNTPTCTAQACHLRDHHTDLLQRGYVVVGISPDKPASHLRFATKYQLPFALVSDTDTAIAQAYGVWQQKQMMGRTYMGVVRTTFVINEQGVITQIISGVKATEHALHIVD